MQVIIQEQEITHVMSMIWQVMLMNGQQRLLAFTALLASGEEALASILASSQAFATAATLPAASTTPASGHFYICRTEL